MSEDTNNQSLASAPDEPQETKKSGTKFKSAKRDFIRWLATPEQLRIPTTARGFAELRGISESTLSVWKGRPEVEAEVRRLVCSDSSLEIADILAALKRAARAGNVAAIKLYLEFVLGWGDGTAIIVENQVEVRFGDEVGFWNKPAPVSVDSDETGVKVGG
jgi:hypothetical protein